MSTIDRPLVQRECNGSGWSMGLGGVPSRANHDIPHFLWTFDSGDGVPGKMLRAMSDSGLLVFQEKNGSNSQGFRSIEGAFRKLDELGWGEPPHIDEVFKDAQETSRKLGEVGGSSSWDAGSILRELQGKWRELSQS